MNYPDEYMSLFHRLTVVASTWVSPQDAEDVVQDVLVGILGKQNLRLQTLFCCAQAYAFMAVKNRCARGMIICVCGRMMRLIMKNRKARWNIRSWSRAYATLSNR